MSTEDIKFDLAREKEFIAEVAKYGPLYEKCTEGEHYVLINDYCQFQCMDCETFFSVKALKKELIEQNGLELYKEEFDRLLKFRRKVSKRKFPPGVIDRDLTLFDYEARDGTLRSRYFYE